MCKNDAGDAAAMYASEYHKQVALNAGLTKRIEEAEADLEKMTKSDTLRFNMLMQRGVELTAAEACIADLEAERDGLREVAQVLVNLFEPCADVTAIEGEKLPVEWVKLYPHCYVLEIAKQALKPKETT